MDESPEAPKSVDRRRFLKLTGAAALLPATGALLTACGSDADPAPADAATPTTRRGAPRKVKLGFIALTDCASLVMAKELGYFEARGLDVTLEKQASWPATRDNLLTGGIDGAHCLFGMPFSVAAGLGGKGERDLLVAMMLTNNGQCITLANDLADARYGDLEAARAVLEQKTPTLAMTFPGGTHDVWLRYWLRATKANLSKVDIVPFPPPTMVANMKVGAMQGYCVGEPWNAVAVAQGIGFTHLATQDLWRHHPEKALVVNRGFAEGREDALRDVMGAVLQASKWLDVPANRSKAATVIGAPGYVNAPADDIRGRLAGDYDLGADLGTMQFDDDRMRFFRDGATNLPRRAHALWFLAQYRRLGLLTTDPPYQELADQLILTDLYGQVAADEGIDVPDDDMAPFTVELDEAVFDPEDPRAEAARA